MLEDFQPFDSGPTRPRVGYTGPATPPDYHGTGRSYAGQPSAAGVRSLVAIPCDLWATKLDGTAAAEVGSFRLVVHPNAAGADARFLVLRHPESTRTCLPTLIASGHGESVEAAMLAAAQTAARLAGDARTSADAAAQRPQHTVYVRRILERERNIEIDD